MSGLPSPVASSSWTLCPDSSHASCSTPSDRLPCGTFAVATPASLSPPPHAVATATAPRLAKKISTTIYVTPEQNDRLKLLHERTKVPVAVYIREGIDLVLRHYAHLLPGQGQLPLDVPAAKK